MSPIEYLFVALSTVIALSGLALVLHSLWIFHRQRTGRLPPSPQISLKFFNLELTGERPLAIFGIGACLVVFPLIYSVEVVTEASRPSVSPNIVPAPGPGEFKEVQEANEPSYKGFHFLKDVRVIDLRSRLPVPKGKEDQEYSPVTWVRYTLLEKLSSEKELIGFEFGTTGVGLNPRCLTHEYDLLKVTGPHLHGEVSLSETWQVQVDVKNEKPGVPFLIINEATYWNAFGGEEQEWAAMNVGEETELIAMVILFPKDKAMKSYDLRFGPHKTKELAPFRDKAVAFRSENHQVFVWKIENPKAGYTYQVDWTW